MSQYLSKKTAPSIETLKKAAINLDNANIIKQELFWIKFQNIFMKYIPNWNISVALNRYCFSQRKLSEAIGLSDSACNLWTKYYNPVPTRHIPAIAQLLHVDAATLENQVMIDMDFVDCQIDLPYSEITAGMIKREDQKNKRRVESQDKGSEETMKEKVNNNKSTMTLNVDEHNMTKPASRTINETLEVPMETKIQKMYGRITEDHREMVNSLIEKYFWEDI